jgi:hypothetical protein
LMMIEKEKWIENYTNRKMLIDRPQSG